MAEIKYLEVEIISPDSLIYSGKASSVMLPGTKSPFEVLINHAPIVSSLEVGLVRIINEAGKSVWFAVGKGFAEVHKNKVSILVDSAVGADKIDNNHALQQVDKLLDQMNEETLTVAEKREIEYKLNIERNILKAYDKVN